MTKPNINPNKIVVFSGAGCSEPSGIETFRGGDDALWHNYDINIVSSKGGYNKNAETVINFYNERKTEILKAKPNEAHLAIAKLEEMFEVVVITTNIDPLHTLAGSSNVMHVHGNIMYAQSSIDENLKYYMGEELIRMGELCEKGSQLRPNVVLYGEEVALKTAAQNELKDAAKILVVGSSLAVKPICNIFKKARNKAEKIIVTKDPTVKAPYGFKVRYGNANTVVPNICERWLSKK